MAVVVNDDLVPILVEEFLWDERGEEKHVFIVGQHVVQVEVLDIDATRLGAFGGDDVVEEDFDRDKFRDLGRFVSWEVNLVASHRASDSVWVCFLRAHFGYDADVCGLFALGNVFAADEDTCVGTLDRVDRFEFAGESLEEPAEFFADC
jgi:hypothetical protein